MTSTFAISAEKRETFGKSASRKLRDNNKLPAVIYGKDKENHHIAVDYKEVTQTFRKGGFYTKICEITVAGKKLKVIPKEVTLHPVTDNIEHVDFYLLNDKEKVKIRANVEFINEAKCVGVKKGGVLNIAARKIELLCYPADIVSKVTVDLVDLAIGESIHVSNIKLPENVEVSKKSAGLTIVTIVGRVEETTEVTESDAEEVTEAQSGEKAVAEEEKK